MTRLDPARATSVGGLRGGVGCGAFTGIQDGGIFWIVDAKFGFAAEPVNGFHIDKRTGKITSPIGPSYGRPFEIFQQAKPIAPHEPPPGVPASNQPVRESGGR